MAEPIPLPIPGSDTSSGRTLGVWDMHGTIKLNRRRVERMKSLLPVKWVEGSGFTRDISESGILFVTECLVDVGKMIKLAVSIPSDRDVDQTIHALCDAKVVRVEKANPSGTEFNIAVAFEGIKLH